MIVPPPCCRITGMTACIADSAPKKLVSNSSWQAGHFHLCDGIHQSVAGVIDPDVDALEMMQGQAENAIDLLGVANIAGKRDGAFGKADALAGGLGPRRIAREQHDACSLLRKNFGDGLADAHGGARDHDHFASEFHARVVFSAPQQVKTRRSCRARPVVQSKNRAACALGGEFVALLPLFPLDVVLLPGSPLPLHIFEPRYKEMIGECLAKNAPFGVVRALEEGMAEVGCTAEIVSVTKEYSDGRMDLVAEGRKRFEVLELQRERAFLQAEVLLVPDEPGAAAEEDKARAIQAHLEILSLAGAVQDFSAADQSALSFYLAGSLPLDLDFKQNLLAMRSESERIQSVAIYLENILPNLRRAAKAREKAGGNGHAR